MTMSVTANKMKKLRSKPKVSIGMPVYNGEKYIREAIDSILAQTFSDFELIICDNASSDRTETICREYVAHDSRIKYYRNAKNLGAASNFNLAFKLSQDKYFKWAAHDDICSSDFLSRCVSALENNNGAVLAFSKVAIIDSDSKVIGPHDFSLPTDSRDRCERFRSLLGGHRCYTVFGLMRRDALEKTGQIMGEYSHGDGVLLERLALQGRFIEIPEYLFFSRTHLEQSMAFVNDRAKYSIWFNPKLKNRVVLPWTRVLVERVRTIHMYPMRFRERLRCYKYLYWTLKWLLPVVAAEIKEGFKVATGRIER